MQDTVSVSVDTAHKLLIVKGLDSDKYYHPSLGNLFVKGNYHLLELELYKDSLKENVRQRIENPDKSLQGNSVAFAGNGPEWDGKHIGEFFHAPCGSESSG